MSASTLLGCTVWNSTSIGTEFQRVDSLVSSGFSESQLKDLTAYLEAQSKTTGMVVLHNGRLAYQYGDVKEVSYIASCRKSVLSMLYGKHVDIGTIDLDEDLATLGIEDNDILLPIEKSATVQDLITARSGVFHTPSNGGYDKRNVKERGSVQPGTYFLYNNWDFNVAGHILELKTGNSIYQEVEEQLAIPMGFQDWSIKNQKKKHNRRRSRYPAYHIYLSTRDMAKIGQLMLNGGQWNGQQLISKEWIDKTITVVTPKDTVNVRYGLSSSSIVQSAYGYMWWLFDDFYGHPDFEGAYTASGYGGQFIMVIPKRNIVIAHKTKLNLLTKWGLKAGGVSDDQFWKIVYSLIANKKSGNTEFAQGNSSLN